MNNESINIVPPKGVEEVRVNEEQVRRQFWCSAQGLLWFLLR